MSRTPSAVLFCCDHNSVRSPMAEGILKQYAGTTIFVQSAGVKHDKDVDGFSVAVCQEIDVELTKHKVRSFEELEDWGDDLESYDLIVALSPTSELVAKEQTKGSAVDVEFWPIEDPTAKGETRNDKLAAYREVRDEIHKRIKERFSSA